MKDTASRLKKVLETAEITRLVDDLVAIPTDRGAAGGETAAAAYLQRFFQAEGVEAAVVPIRDGRGNVTARLKGRGGGRSLLLTSHLDTVPPYDLPEPYRPRIEGGRLYGRGAADAKGPLACMAAAMVSLKRSGIDLAGDLIFAGVIDEEGGSAGTRALVKDDFDADAAVVGEPTGLDLCLGHRGLVWLEVVFRGQTVHGGQQDTVLNTITMAARFIERVETGLLPRLARRVHPLLGAASLNYGLICGGTQPSTVPGKCILQLDRRWLPGEDYLEIIGELASILDTLRQEDARFEGDLAVMSASVMDEGWVHCPMELDPAHPLVEIAASSVRRATGRDPARRSFTAWSDAGILSAYGGIPCLVLGPGDLACAHSAAEHILVAELLPAALAYALIAARYCR